MHPAMYPFSAETMEFRQVVHEATQLQREERKLRLGGDARGAARIQKQMDRLLATVDGNR
jgi:hypothetical protein